MPGKPTLSPTKISTFLACPVRYRWTFVDPRGKFYMRAKSNFSFGTTLHRVLERFHDSGDAGVETVHQALAALEESWIDAGFSSAEEMADAYGEGQAILERHIEEAASRTVTAETLYVEKTFKLDFPEFELVGRVDRVDQHADGALEIVDYKSGRQQVTDDDVRTDLAMTIYQLMLARHSPGHPVRATILALRTGASGTSSLALEDLDAFEADLRQLGALIVSNEAAEAPPVYKRLCNACEFVPLCRRHPSFVEAEVAAKR